MRNAPYVSLVDFAQTFEVGHDTLPAWVHHGDASVPQVLEQVGLRRRVEDVLDTVVALQRAEWLADGVYAGPSAMPEV